MSHSAVDSLNDKYLRLFGIPASVVAMLLAQMPSYFPGRWDLFWRYLSFSMVFTVLIWEAARIILLRIRKKYPGLYQTRGRIVRILVSFILLAAVGHALIAWIVLYFGWSETDAPYWKVWLVNFSGSLFFIALIGSVYEAIYFFSQYRNNLQQAEALKKEQAKASFDALKNRVNPHFLFNSLTTLSALIGENPPRAERFVDELSKVYRYLLRAGRQPLIELKEELHFAESYAFLLENRFGTGEFSIVVDKKIESLAATETGRLLPGLTFKHAVDFLVGTQNLPLKIEVEMKAECLRFTCDDRPKSRVFETTENDRRYLEEHGVRLQVLYGRQILDVPFSKVQE